MHPSTPTRLGPARLRSLQESFDPTAALGDAGRNARYAAYQAHELAPDTPVLHLEDVSGIPFLTHISGLAQYQHRARVRAGEGDLFAAVVPSAPGYEDYCRDHLGLGAPTCLLPEPSEPSIAGEIRVARACAEGAAFEALVEVAQARGGLLIHPYMAIEDVWQLAVKVQDAAGVPVRVLGPLPDILWLANDKNALDRLVRTLDREASLVETHRSKVPNDIAEAMRDMASRHPLVGLKRTRCASAMGNAVFTAEQILDGPLEHTLKEVETFLAFTEWEGDEEILIVQWIDTVCSPSTQLWLPPLGEGEPRLEGVYEQLLAGPERVFVGSHPSTLPAPVEHELAYISLEIAAAFQAMGYIGRCSFDFVVGGDLDGDFQVYLTECNGRWGGTSTPMMLVDRIVEGPRPAYIAKDFVDERFAGADFLTLLEKTRDHLFNPKTQTGHYIFYNVGPIPEKGKFDVIALGADVEEAQRRAGPELAALLGI